jgi:hypothetical protein
MTTTTGQCAGCGTPIDARSAEFSVTHFGELGAPPAGGYSACSASCLRDLGIDLSRRDAEVFG